MSHSESPPNAAPAGAAHLFDAIAFVDDLPQRRLAEIFPEARPRVHALHLDLPGGGEVFLYSFGAIVLHAVAKEEREALLARLRQAWPELATDAVREDFQVVERPGAIAEVTTGVLGVDRLTPDRAAVVALTVAQSVAMETYERLLDRLFARTRVLVTDLERRGTTGLRTRSLHRFIAEATGNRIEVLSVLHLLDRPEAVWEDPGMDRIYEDLRDEFDLADRYAALSVKSRGVQEALELVLDTARDRRVVLLEVAVVALIALEIVLALLRIT